MKWKKSCGTNMKKRNNKFPKGWHPNYCQVCDDECGFTSHFGGTRLLKKCSCRPSTCTNCFVLISKRSKNPGSWLTWR